MIRGIGDFVAQYKGESAGHPFRGNQYGESGGGDSSTSKKVLFEKPKTYDGKKTIKVAMGTHLDENGSINGVSQEHQNTSLTIQETDRGSGKFNVIHTHYEGSGKETQYIKDIIHSDIPLKDAKTKAQDWLERRDMEHRART